MPGAIRNICVARGNVTTTGVSILYTVPAGNVFIFKALVITNNSGGSLTLQWVLNQVGVLTLQGPDLTVAAAKGLELATWHVLNAGDRFGIQASAQPYTYWLSGAVLPYA